MCNQAPEILFRLNLRSPLKQRVDDCELFREFAYYNKIDCSVATHTFADISEVSYEKALAKALNAPKVDLTDKMPYLYMANQMMVRTFGPIMQNSRTISVADAVACMPKDTSVGPLERTHYKNKGDYVDKMGCSFYVRHWEEMAEEGCGYHYFSGNLKDELRLAHKVESHSTRFFYAGPHELYVAGAQLFYDQNQKMIDAVNYHESPSCIGIINNSAFYERLVQEQRMYDFSACTDIVGFDTRIPSVVMWFIAIFRFWCFGIEYRTAANWCRVKNYYRDVIFTPLVLKNGVVIFLFQGNPSGQYCTAFDNTFSLKFFFSYVWVRAGGKPEDFDKYVKIYIYGDDSVLFWNQPPFEFNETIISKYMAELGMEVEFADNLEFLGHYVTLHEDFQCHVGCLTYERILSALIAGPGIFDVAQVWERACGIRNSAFTNKEAFKLCTDYCAWLLESFPDQIDIRQFVPEYQLAILQQFPQENSGSLKFHGAKEESTEGSHAKHGNPSN